MNEVWAVREYVPDSEYGGGEWVVRHLAADEMVARQIMKNLLTNIEHLFSDWMDVISMRVYGDYETWWENE